MRQKEKGRKAIASRIARLAPLIRAIELAYLSMWCGCKCNTSKTRRRCPWYQPKFEV